MEFLTASHIRLGDWVSGTTFNDEKFIGYVEAMSAADGLVKVYVTESDRTEAVGTLVESSRSKLSRLPEQAPYLEDELSSLIDLALQTRDEVWFRELTAALLEGRGRKGSSADNARRSSGPRRVKID
ncbi:IDEAL domain-containing protein [Paenibacillus hamazuiensis]|uniref:IDEAL domain-containing protein n=1 Tax=Paenibacillus hamazuiensis TaxID=2936508 RepID=UPI0020106D3C|nr:IDEAL domain-containing protein [Paenibacillus hamazuiensis]